MPLVVLLLLFVVVVVVLLLVLSFRPTTPVLKWEVVSPEGSSGDSLPFFRATTLSLFRFALPQIRRIRSFSAFPFLRIFALSAFPSSDCLKAKNSKKFCAFFNLSRCSIRRMKETSSGVVERAARDVLEGALRIKPN